MDLAKIILLILTVQTIILACYLRVKSILTEKHQYRLSELQKKYNDELLQIHTRQARLKHYNFLTYNLKEVLSKLQTRD